MSNNDNEENNQINITNIIAEMEGPITNPHISILISKDYNNGNKDKK